MATHYTNGSTPHWAAMLKPENQAKAQSNRYALTKNEPAVRKMVRTGYTDEQIADAFGVNAQSVCDWRLRRGLRKRARSVKEERPAVEAKAEPLTIPTLATAPAETIEALLVREVEEARAACGAAVRRYDAAYAALYAYRATIDEEGK